MSDKVINKIIAAFESLRNKQFFVSEAHFQHVLAIELKKKLCKWYSPFRKAKIILEFPIIQDNKLIHVDIMVVTPYGNYPIELKYKTKRIKSDVLYPNTNIKMVDLLKDHSAPDINGYECWKDISRIEKLIDSADAKSGVCIVLTNEPYYWQGKSGVKSQGYPFRMLPGVLYKAGEKDWNIQGNQVRTKTLKEYPKFNIKNDYQFEWKDFYKDSSLPNCLFKSVLIVIDKK